MRGFSIVLEIYLPLHLLTRTSTVSSNVQSSSIRHDYIRHCNSLRTTRDTTLTVRETQLSVCYARRNSHCLISLMVRMGTVSCHLTRIGDTETLFLVS